MWSWVLRVLSEERFIALTGSRSSGFHPGPVVHIYGQVGVPDVQRATSPVLDTPEKIQAFDERQQEAVKEYRQKWFRATNRRPGYQPRGYRIQ